MLRSAIQIYALAVCFCTLMCLAVAMGIGIYDVVQISVPQFTVPWIDPYLSNDQFVARFPDRKDLPAHEIDRLRENGLNQAIGAERRAAGQSAAFVLIIIAIDAVIFAFHWRLARRSEPPALVSPLRPTGDSAASAVLS